MIDKLKELCFKAIIKEKTKLHKHITIDDIIISRLKNYNYGHFQLNNSNFLSKCLNLDVYSFYKILKEYFINFFKYDEIIIDFINPVFINFKISISYLEKEFLNFSFIKTKKKLKIILDYSGPNIAKHMHVGHLRSTIVGDCLSNLFIINGNKVIKINHLGDWGMQFGILIAYLKKYVDLNKFKLSISKLSNFYKKGYIKYFSDIIFKNNVKKELFLLQNESKESIDIWKNIKFISRLEYNKIYNLLGVKIYYKSESFYRHLLKGIVSFLEKKKKVILSDGAKCIYLNGFFTKDKKPLPLIIQKSDSSFNYATIELATLYYRLKYHSPDKIIYITDIGQKNHFMMVFKVINDLKINNKCFLIHIPIGLMLNADGKKIKTRSGNSKKLFDFIKKAIYFSKKAIKEKNKFISKKKLYVLSYKLAINTIKYSDLSNKLDKNYVFEYEKMLQFKGNTAAFLIYAYVRIISILNKLKKNFFYNFNKYNLKLVEIIEIKLCLHILQYNFIISESIKKNDPNILTVYLYELAEIFHSFFHSCKVINSEFFKSRIIICKITKKIFEHGFKCLGFKIIKKM